MIKYISVKYDHKRCIKGYSAVQSSPLYTYRVQSLLPIGLSEPILTYGTCNSKMYNISIYVLMRAFMYTVHPKVKKIPVSHVGGLGKIPGETASNGKTKYRGKRKIGK
jgi:hypothetical protein